MSAKKRVSIIGPSFRFLSGISYYTVYLSNALSKPFQVHAVLFRNMLPKKLFPGSGRVGKSLSTTEYLPEIKKSEILDWYNPATWHHAVLQLKQTDICIFEWWTSSVAHMYLWMGLALKRNHIPLILEYHEVVDTLEDRILPISIYARILGKLIRNLASAYIVHSEADKNLVAQRYRIDPEKITVMPHGLYDTYAVLNKSDAKRELGLADDKRVILFFGLLRPYKGVTYLIDAFEQLPNQLLETTVLIIAGEAWEDKDAIDRAKSSPVADKIILFSEYISDTDIPKFFSAADVLVLPYTRASQSGVAHIGISYGIPVVCSQVGGLVESMSKYDGTRFVPPKDSKILAKTLQEIIGTEIGKTYEIPSELTWTAIAEKWKEYLH